jgi:hypothetical protein
MSPKGVLTFDRVPLNPPLPVLLFQIDASMMASKSVLSSAENAPHDGRQPNIVLMKASQIEASAFWIDLAVLGHSAGKPLACSFASKNSGNAGANAKSGTFSSEMPR